MPVLAALFQTAGKWTKRLKIFFYYVSQNPVRLLSKRILKTASEGLKTRIFLCHFFFQRQNFRKVLKMRILFLWQLAVGLSLFKCPKSLHFGLPAEAGAVVRSLLKSFLGPERFVPVICAS
jgi:hypothetical protein